MGSLRISAGAAKGRKLLVPEGPSIRPTSDRVRQAIFNVLGQFFEGERVLDLFAGSGALGLEALSRGAGRATLVEQDRAAIEVLTANVRHLGWEERARVLRSDVGAYLRGAGAKDFDLVFMDPPYDLPPDPYLVALGELGLPAGAWVVVEHEAGWSPEQRYGKLEKVESRRYGATSISFFEVGSEEAS